MSQELGYKVNRKIDCAGVQEIKREIDQAIVDTDFDKKSNQKFDRICRDMGREIVQGFIDQESNREIGDRRGGDRLLIKKSIIENGDSLPSTSASYARDRHHSIKSILILNDDNRNESFLQFRRSDRRYLPIYNVNPTVLERKKQNKMRQPKRTKYVIYLS